MPVTATNIVNQALMLIGGNQPLVTGNSPNFDQSTAGKAAAQLYAPCVATVMRQFGWDAARRTVELTLSGNIAPVPWAFEYLYPELGIQVWNLMPAVIDDPFDPLPINFVVANAVVTISAVETQKRVIHTNLEDAVAVFNNNPTEDNWDAGLREAVVRLLASELAMAIASKPETSQNLLTSGAALENAAEERRN